MIITIHLNFTLPDYKYYSYGELKDLLGTKDNKNYITHNTDLFSFDELDDVEDVVVVKETNNIYSYISLSELLNSEICKFYTCREIRRAHNARKMLIANVFEWRKM